jgi:hypothetical protein
MFSKHLVATPTYLLSAIPGTKSGLTQIAPDSACAESKAARFYKFGVLQRMFRDGTAERVNKPLGRKYH